MAPFGAPPRAPAAAVRTALPGVLHPWLRPADMKKDQPYPQRARDFRNAQLVGWAWEMTGLANS